MSRHIVLGLLVSVSFAVGCASKESADRTQPGPGEPVPAAVPDEASKTASEDAGTPTTTDALGVTGSAGTGAGPSSAADLGSATDAGTPSGAGAATGSTATPADAGTSTRAAVDAGTSTRLTADAGTPPRSTADAGTSTRAAADAGTRAPTTGAAPATVAAPDKKIERLWKAKCASCHGADGKAQTEQGRKMQLSDMSQPKWQAARTDARLKKVILEGWDQTVGGVKQEMPGYKDELSPEQVDALLQYVRWVGQR